MHEHGGETNKGTKRAGANEMHEHCPIVLYQSVPVSQCPCVPMSRCPSNLGGWRNAQGEGTEKHTRGGGREIHKRGAEKCKIIGRDRQIHRHTDRGSYGGGAHLK